MTPSTDVLGVALLLSAPQRYLRVFHKADFNSPGSRAIFSLLRKREPLSALGIVCQTEDVFQEAQETIRQAKKIRSQDLEEISRLLLRKVQFNRVILGAVEEGLEVDFPRLIRKLKTIQTADLSPDDRVQKGEWKEYLQEAQDEEKGSISTGLDLLDTALEGGLWTGELGAVVAPSFRGKTHLLVHLGVAALEAGVPVLHLSLEIARHHVALRYAQNSLRLTRPEVMQLARDNKKQLHGRLSRKWKAPLRVVSCRGADRELSQILRRIHEFPPGLILVDALELARNRGIVESWKQAGELVVDLRDTFQDTGSSGWVTYQTNRGGYDNPNYSMAAVSESQQKIWVTDVMILMQQGPGDVAYDRMRLNICKARERVMGACELAFRAVTEHQRFTSLD